MNYVDKMDIKFVHLMSKNQEIVGLPQVHPSKVIVFKEFDIRMIRL